MTKKEIAAVLKQARTQRGDILPVGERFEVQCYTLSTPNSMPYKTAPSYLYRERGQEGWAQYGTNGAGLVDLLARKMAAQ